MTARALALLTMSGLLLEACATVRSGSMPKTSKRERIRGEVVLADGKAVADVAVALRCGDRTFVATTDAEGRFVMRSAMLRSGCQAWLERHGRVHPRARWTVDRTRNVLRDGSLLHLAVRPAHRLRVRIAGPKGEAVVVLLDQARDRIAAAGVTTLTRRHALLGTMKLQLAAREGRPVVSRVEGLPRGWRFAGAETIALPTLPPALRQVPVAHDRRRLTLLRDDRMLRLEQLTGERTLVWVGRCAQVEKAIARDLSGIEASRGLWGLRTLMVGTDSCRTDPASAAANGAGEGAYYGGAEATWAFDAAQPTLLVLGPDGAVLWRQVVGEPAESVGRALAFLRRSWPVFAAAERVSVATSATVSRATVARLLTQAAALARRGESKAAAALFDRALILAPQHAEARRRRALLKAALGDLCGAMSDVGWWRDHYGDDSADELLDEVKRSSPAGAAAH